ncbi:MAG: PilZ domain-containing protein [Nitrospira sp.]|nr:PilZ domain-containing protein [Nitrospira sp.]
MSSKSKKRGGGVNRGAAGQVSGVSSPQDRRDQPRFNTQFRSSLSGQYQEGQGRTLDVSSGGCKIESDLKVEQGATFECRLHIPGLDWPLRVDEATVRWTDGKTFGIAFTKIDPQELEKLKTVLADLDEGEE